MIVVTSGNRNIDIDAYATMIAYANLLNIKGIPAKAVTSTNLNESITKKILSMENKLDKYEIRDGDEFIVVDVSDKVFIDDFVDINRVVEIIDHHPGFESEWKNLGNKAIIEPIGAVATIIEEMYEKEGYLEQMPQDIAYMLMTAILDNTLNLKAKVTTPRDIKSYNRLNTIVKNNNLAEEYFKECQESIMINPIEAIKNDTKIGVVSKILPQVFGQLVLWNIDYFIRNINLLIETMNTFDDEWIMNLISLKDGKSYIIAIDEKIKKKMEDLFNLKFNDNIMELDDVWLRKEIIKMTI